jgi:hypothetical protein
MRTLIGYEFSDFRATGHWCLLSGRRFEDIACFSDQGTAAPFPPLDRADGHMIVRHR